MQTALPRIVSRIFEETMIVARDHLQNPTPELSRRMKAPVILRAPRQLDKFLPSVIAIDLEIFP